MQVVRVYSGDDGESRFEDFELPYGPLAEGYRTTPIQAARGVQFYWIPEGQFFNWHTAPRRQYVITLEGGAEIGVGGGVTRIFRPGDVELVEDLSGRGHTSRVVGGKPRIMIAIPLAD